MRYTSQGSKVKESEKVLVAQSSKSALQADSLPSEPPGKPSKAETMTNTHTQTLRHSRIPKPTDLKTQSIPVS